MATLKNQQVITFFQPGLCNSRKVGSFANEVYYMNNSLIINIKKLKRSLYEKECNHHRRCW